MKSVFPIFSDTSFLSNLTWNLNILFLFFFLQEPLYMKKGYVSKLSVISDNNCGFDWKKSVLDALQSCLETRKVPAGSYSCWRRPHSLCLSHPGNLNSSSSSELQYPDSFSTSAFCFSMYLCVTSNDRNEHCCGPHSLPWGRNSHDQSIPLFSSWLLSSSMARHGLWSFTVSQDVTELCIKLWLSLTERCGSDLGGLPPAARECLFSSLLPDSSNSCLTCLLFYTQLLVI